jgi:uncharacterized SAM-binding protein YcdF (DUF218 family)
MRSRARDDGTSLLNQYVTPIKLVLITLLLLFFALFALWRRRRLQIAFVVLLLAWAFGTGWLTRPMLDAAQHGYLSSAEPRFAPDTTLVILGGGTDREDEGLVPKRDAKARIAATARLYGQCKRTGAVCKVIVSGGDPQHHGQAEADNYAPYLLAQGVAPADLTRENKSLNTYENARNVAVILGHSHDNGLIVVTSAYHMRRALKAFAIFGYVPQYYISDARHNPVTLFPRFRSFENGEVAAHELVGMARFYVWRWLHLY